MCFLYHSVGAQESLNEKVTLKPCDTYDLSRVQTPADYQTLANSTEALEGIEACMLVWIKQVEQVSYLFPLASSADNLCKQFGPRLVSPDLNPDGLLEVIFQKKGAI